MAVKRKPKIQASDVEVGNRTLEAALLDLAERSTKALEEIAVLRKQTSVSLERSAAMLDHLSALTRDHMGIAARVEALEKSS